MYACDTFVANPRLEAWRAATVAAPLAATWAWVGQIRAAPYSYDRIDNAGKRSPRQLLEWPEPVVGEPFTRVGGRPCGRIVDVRPLSSLTGTIMGGYLTYALTAESPTTARLVLKVVADPPPLVAGLHCLGDPVMARRQLLNLQAHAEGSSSAQD